MSRFIQRLIKMFVKACNTLHLGFTTIMKRSSVSHLNSGVARALEVVGEWWTPLIIRAVFLGHTRYDKIQGELGIARNVLSDRLSSLVGAGVLMRVQYSERPQRFEYQLTEMGRDLFGTLAMLKAWGDKWLAGETATAKITHESCGAIVSPVVWCEACGKHVSGDETKLINAPSSASIHNL
jgi:DNA-binding HxlR family transcriptional regulator